MLHKKLVAQAVYYSIRRRARIALGRRPTLRPPPILGQSLEVAVERHSGIARAILKNLPAGLELAGKTVCEVGAGDCLAGVSLFLGLGARRVDVVEIVDPVINEKQREVLKTLQSQGMPMDLTFIEGDGDDLRLNADRVRYHKTYMENFQSTAPVDFLFSFYVLEHVEDLDGFYQASAKVMSPGAHMLHVIDLGGHSMFEDPVPPLDFQTYPNWLYNWMYPPYCRATRRFLDQHTGAIERNGFKILEMKPLRTASGEYLGEIWPKLRKEAQGRPRKDISVIEFAVAARKND